MARMHSRKRGKAGSKKPMKKVLPLWVRYKSKELELLIVKLAKEGKTPSQIGVILRDTYGIPDEKLVTKKNITKILEEKKVLPELPEDLTALIKKAISIKKHMEINKKDEKARFGLLLTESKIKRLTKYYQRAGKLPSEWRYEPEKAALVMGGK